MDRTGAKIKRPFQGRVLLQHQEAHLHPPTCKRRSTEDPRSMGEERKGRVGSWKENQNPVQRNRGTTNLRRPYTQPSELGAGILKETNYSENDSWKTWTLDQNWPQYATGSMMRITRVGAKARAAVDCGPGGMSSRHGSGVQVQSGRELIQSSRALLQHNGQDIQSIQALALSSQAQVQSSQAQVQSSQALVQSRGLLVKGSAGLQVRVAVIKRTRLDPLPSVGPLAAPTIYSRAPAVTSGQRENPRSPPSLRRPSLARAGASGGPGSAGGTQEPAQEKGGPGATRGAQTGPETAAGARGCFLESTAEPTPRKTRRKIRLSGVRGRGQLQLSIQLEGDGLDIHIYQARGLLGRNCGSCDTYVKLSLIPDVDHSTRRKTPTVVNSKYPEYNQHFALNVDTENLLKRLQVTVWRRRLSTSRRSEFLGCMSFGIRSLLRSSKSISGWYYLLGAELGRTKHLKVAATETKAITPANRAKGRHGEKTPDATPDKPPSLGLSSRARTERNKPQLGPLPGSGHPTLRPVPGSDQYTLGPVPGSGHPTLGPVPGSGHPTLGPVPGSSQHSVGPVPGSSRSSLGPCSDLTHPIRGSGSELNQLLLGAAGSDRNKRSDPGSGPMHLPMDTSCDKLSVVHGLGSNKQRPAADSSDPSKASLGRASGSSEQGPKDRLRSMFTLESKASLCRPGVSVQNGKPTLMVSIMRGNDGFGFTICSDSPVRVQSVEPGGPGNQAGLQQGDCVLQMNGVPVESWQCVDLAHAIRSSTQIVLVVWRGQPDLKPPCAVSPASTTVKKLLPHPPNSKHGRRRGQGSGVKSRLGSLWREEEPSYPPATTTTTLKGTRVTSSNGDNYIILSPVNPGSQMLQTVYQDENGTIGRLYQTHPSRGLHQQEPHFLQQPPVEWSTGGGGGHSFQTTTLPPPSSSTSLVLSTTPVLSGCYNNYQNCTMVQSHAPCSGYGAYGTLAPKTLIFPVFVQPLDLCSADRTLLMAEEMVLHQGPLQPTKVTVLIYTDLILLTREDEAGRCNVLQSPLYLHNTRLHYVNSEPLRLYLAQCVCEHWECDISLEAFSHDQKTRVSLCLHDNITQQLAVPVETPHSNQRDVSLLSLGQLDLTSRPSSPYATFSDLPLRTSSPPPHPPHPPHPHPPPPHFLPFSPERCGPSPWILASPMESPSKRSSYPPLWREREGRGGGGGEAEGDRVTERLCGRTCKGRETRREREQEREERQAAEGQSVSEASESIWGGDSAPLSCCSSPLPPISPPPPYDMVRSARKTQRAGHSTEDEEEEEEEEEEDLVQECTSPFRLGAPRSLQRSLSEGSLLQEPRSPYFLSDSTIHRLTRPSTSEPDQGRPPSPHTLRRELTREGGSLQQMFHFLNGVKDRESKYGHQKRKKSLAEDIRSRMAFLRRQNNFNANSLERAFRNGRPPLEEVWRWADSFEALLSNKYGMAVFRHFLRSEFSEENLDFWLAVDKYKKTRTLNKMATRAHSIFNEFISTSASRQVNVDSSVREVTNQNLRQAPGPASFQLAQEQIYSLMESDSYPRFLKSLLYSQLANQRPAHAQTDCQNEKGSTKSFNGIGPTSLASQSEQKTLI
ncbi:regulator of G-protein signaling 3-like [Gadus chalcogrammus]|uniref:regulator of G-protein signaling 3-like n=1 Tax=Gadus chalcogrammus TaxID=1042646 RepID=UPI0024C2612A|nr:regulator of G-protein signaling 3-like [Gadus chalcogrammus]